MSARSVKLRLVISSSFNMMLRAGAFKYYEERGREKCSKIDTETTHKKERSLDVELGPALRAQIKAVHYCMPRHIAYFQHRRIHALENRKVHCKCLQAPIYNKGATSVVHYLLE